MRCNSAAASNTAITLLMQTIKFLHRGDKLPENCDVKNHVTSPAKMFVYDWERKKYFETHFS